MAKDHGWSLGKSSTPGVASLVIPNVRLNFWKLQKLGEELAAELDDIFPVCLEKWKRLAWLVMNRHLRNQGSHGNGESSTLIRGNLTKSWIELKSMSTLNVGGALSGLPWPWLPIEETTVCKWLRNAKQKMNLSKIITQRQFKIRALWARFAQMNKALFF